MKKMRNLLIFSLLALFVLPSLAWAKESIQASLIQPALYKAKAGDPYSLQLEVYLPQDYLKEYKSLAVSMMLDAKLDVLSETLTSPSIDKSTYRVSHTKMSQSKKNLVNLTINDLGILKGERKVIFQVNTKIADGQKDISSLENSYVLTYMDKDGVEGSFQKDLVTTPPKEGTSPEPAAKPVPEKPAPSQDGITINPITAKDSLVKGKAMANTNIRVFRGQTPIAYGRTEADGSFEIVMNPQPEGVTLRFEFIDKTGSKFKDITIQKEGDKGPVINKVAGIEALLDYLEAVSKLPKDKLNQEQAYQLEAAISLGKYFSIKSGLKEGEVELALNQLKEAYKVGRPAFMVGYQDGTFGPNKSMIRAEVAVALAKTLDNGKLDPNFSSFKDVDESKWYAGGIGQMEKKGIISGYEDGNFRPNKAITRGEFAAIVANYMKLESTSGAESFRDVKKSAWNYEIIKKVSSAGLMNGSGDGRFRPDDKISRQEVATVINKMTGRTPNEKIISQYGNNPFKDVKKSSWAYYQIIEVTGN